MITYDNKRINVVFRLFLLQMSGYICRVTKKNFLAFRINPELKQQIEEIAGEEQRSVSQICELFLSGAVDDYKRQGPQFIRRLLVRQKEKMK
jgi:hypothetical protein